MRNVIEFRQKFFASQHYASMQYIEDIQVFGVNMSFISLSEVKFFLYFMSAEGTNEIYNFSLHEMK